MKTIAMYDVIEIQNFIFASNKVKENIGASIIVRKVFDNFLIDAIKEYGKCRLDWKTYTDFPIIKNSDIQTEVIFTGGGNAMVAYRNRETAMEITKKLSHKLLQKTGGTLKFAVAYLDTEFTDYLEDRDKLIKTLKINKYQMIHQTPLLGIGITRQGGTDGLPATEHRDEDDEYLSKSADLKRKTWKEEKKYFNRLLSDTGDYDFPTELDDLGQQIGENYIAVVHIDGNNMGKMLNDCLESDQTSNYEQSIQIVREFSKQVDTKFKSVMRKVVDKLVNGLKHDEFSKKLKLVVEKENLLLPIRPIVLNGDDVTFVCNGKIGIALAEEFLTQLNKDSEINISDSTQKLSACAGVAIVKSHFPFYRAYRLAEELCGSAKIKGKTLAKIKEIEEIANWLDFHIVQTGITTSLNEIRNKFYQVPGMDSPDPIEYEEYGDVQMKVKQYNLLWRPWCVAGNCDEEYQWEAFKSIFNQFEKEWKRSRSKNLEKQMTRSLQEAENDIQKCRSREFELPEFLGSTELYREKRTPYFDVLELSDFYIQLPQKNGEIKP